MHLDCVLLCGLHHSLAFGDLQQAGGVYRKVYAQLGRLGVLSLRSIDPCMQWTAIVSCRWPTENPVTARSDGAFAAGDVTP